MSLIPNNFNINRPNTTSGKRAGRKIKKNIISKGKFQKLQMKNDAVIVKHRVRRITARLLKKDVLFLRKI